MKTSNINSGLNGQRPIRSSIASPLVNKAMRTTNIKLIELAKCLSISNFDCIFKDDISVLLKQGLAHTSLTSPNSPTNIIVNLNDSDKNVNGHWCLCFIDNEQQIYYSSYGNPIPIEVKQYIMEVDNKLLLSSNF